MTKKQFRQKYNYLINEPDGLRKLLKVKAEQILISGAIDLSDFKDDYQLPKAVLCAVLKNAAWEYHPFSKEGKDLVKNLEHF